MAEVHSIPLRIDEPTGVRRERWPVRWGVPFPKGRLASPETVRLLGPEGQEVPCAVSVSAQWPDGSVKWLLLQFQITLEPQTRATCTVEYGPGVHRTDRPSSLSVQEAGDRLAVRTGPLEFSVSRSHFAGVEGIRLNGLERLAHPLRARITDGDGIRYEMHPDGPSEVVVEEQSSERVTLRAKGRHRATDGRTLFDYLLRISAYPDLPHLELEYTFLNTEDAEYTSLREIALSVPVRLDGPSVGLCGAGRRLHRLEEPFHFTHGHVIEKYGIFAGSPIYRADGTRLAGVGLYEQALASGWLDISDGQGGLAVTMRDFVWTYPKEAAWRDGEIVFSLWPARSEPLRLHQGMARTHRFLLHLHDGDGESSRVHETACAFNEPLLPWNGPWYLESGAFGDVLRPDRYPRLERALRDLTNDARNRRTLGAFDYGDSVNPGTGSQGGFSTNNEHDVPHGHLLQFVRTGERIPFHLADAGVWHTMDVDIVHHTTRSPVERGGQRIHGHGHLQYDAEGYPDVSAVPSHTWTEGLLEYHYLTGHPRAREIALGIADCLLKMVDLGWAQPPYHSAWHSSRDSGWPLIALSAVYEATGDDRYRRAMRRIFEALAAAQGPEGGWSMELGFHTGHCPFQVGIGLTGVGRYHEVTGDGEAREVLLRGMAFLAGDGMRFPDGAWVYATTPDYRLTYRSDTPLEPFGYAYRITGDRRLIEAGLRGWTQSLDLRASLRFLWAADKAGLLEDI